MSTVGRRMENLRKAMVSLDSRIQEGLAATRQTERAARDLSQVGSELQTLVQGER